MPSATGEPPALVSVPTHFYKVVVADGRGEGGGGRVGVGAFVMPNAPIDPRIPLAAFAVPLEPLEALAGALGDRKRSRRLGGIRGQF